MSSFSRIPRFPHLIRPPSGLSGELFFLRQEIADALENAVGGGGGWSFVMNALPGAVPDPSMNAYTPATFNDFMTAIDALPVGVTPQVQFLGNFTFPMQGPSRPSGWNFRLGSWSSPILATGACSVTIPEGVKINSLSFINNGLLVTANPTATTPFNWDYYDSLTPGSIWVLGVGLGACLRNGGTIPLIQGPGTGKYIVMATQAPSFFAVPPSTAPFVNADAPDLVIEAQTFSGFYGSLPDGWLTGSAIRIRQRGLDTRPAVVTATGPVVFNAQSILNPHAMSGARKTIIYTNKPIDPTETDRFDDFEAFYVVYSELSGPIDIELDQDPAGPALEIPAKAGGGFFQMKPGTRWTSGAGNGQPCQVSLEPGAEVRDLSWIGDNVAVVGNGGQLTWTAPVPGGNPKVLILNGFGAVMASQSGGPLIDWGYDLSVGGPLIVAITKASSITKGGGGGPIINITPTGAWTSGVIVYNIDGTFDESVLSGSDGPGTAMFGSIVGPGAQHSLKQPAWTSATPLDSAYQSIARPRFNIQTAPITAVGPYIMGDVTGIFSFTNGENGSEFVRVDPSANIVKIQLPDPASCVGQTVLIKQVGAAPAFNVEVTALSGNVERVVTYVIAPADWAAMQDKIKFTPDGTDWWIS